MSVIVVSYATPVFKPSQARLRRSALEHGVHRVIELGPRDIRESDFWDRNQEILRFRTGAGYFIWKPFVVGETLRRVGAADFVVYLDAGVEIVRDLSPLLELLDGSRDFALFQTHGHLNRTWTKRDCFVLMGCDSEKYHEAEQTMGGISIYRPTSTSIDFADEWLRWCENPAVATSEPNVCGLPDLPGYQGHRWDQSVQSLIALKHDLPVFRDPSQFGNHMKVPAQRVEGEYLEIPYSDQPWRNSDYPTIFNHHRTRAIPFAPARRKLQIRRRINSLHAGWSRFLSSVESDTDGHSRS